MNLIFDALEENPEVQIIVFTTKNNTSYQTPVFPNTTIYRFGIISQNPMKRYLSYIYFNLVSSILLLTKQLDFITAFESLSVLPLWVRSKLKSKTEAHIHYHEYLSEPERQMSSPYMKLLYRLEDQLLRQYNSSHTNEDRKSFFLNDKSFLRSHQVLVRPNLPPKSWWNNYGKYRISHTNGKLRLLHLGTCDDNTMYIREILEWVSSHQDKYELTFISQQIDQKTRELISRFNCDAIFLKKAVDYYDLPQEIVKYDIGLILYKGHIPNFVYNVPNKVHEYLSCGLKVICDKSLKTTVNLNDKNIYSLELKSLNQLEIDLIH